jgi:NAD(P)-dependent dehydrogenase (short-subunit alcohol dehydrogenase family)
LQLGQAGAAVVVAARTVTEVQDTAHEIRQAGGRAEALSADVSDLSTMRELAGETAAVFGLPDIVVANASILDPVGDSWEVEPEAWSRNIAVNLTGAFYTGRVFLPEMVRRGSGVLIFVSSGAASHPVPGWSAYCAAKAGLDHFVRNLAAELDQKELPIRVHLFYPGVVATDMQKEIRDLSPEQFSLVEKYHRYYEQNKLRPPEEPAQVIRWLATPLARDLHGQVASIDDEKIRNRVNTDLEAADIKERSR